MGRRLNYPCFFCGENIHLGKIKDEEIMWNHDDDEIAHTKCLPKDYDVDKWITTDETRMSCCPDDI